MQEGNNVLLKAGLEEKVFTYVEDHRDRLVEVLRDLVQLASENTPPTGNEQDCQHHVAEFLRHVGWDPVLYRPTDVAAITEHPLYWPGRDYSNRPNVGARRRGSGGGRSLVLSGHIDTVPCVPQRQPHLLVQDGRQGQRLRPQLHVADSYRVGSLQGMASLHAPVALAAPYKTRHPEGGPKNY